MLAQFYWDPNRVFITLPFLERGIAWYGVLFASGFLAAFFILRHLFDKELKRFPLLKEHLWDWSTFKRSVSLVHDKEALQELNDRWREDKSILGLLPHKRIAHLWADKFSIYVGIGVLLGARLGYVFFYGWPLYKDDPWAIFKTWEGGLASHGATVGILVAVMFFCLKKMNLSYLLSLLDILIIPACVMSAFIRVGNFINQEIVGRPSKAPWAVVFGHPFDGSAAVARHPVQLYESLFYLSLAAFFYALWKFHKVRIGQGRLFALLMTLLFGFRFWIEFYKMPQGYVLESSSPLLMGQILSIPFVFLGLFLLWRSYQKKGDFSSLYTS